MLFAEPPFENGSNNKNIDPRITHQLAEMRAFDEKISKCVNDITGQSFFEAPLENNSRLAYNLYSAEEQSLKTIAGGAKFLVRLTRIRNDGYTEIYRLELGGMPGDFVVKKILRWDKDIGFCLSMQSEKQFTEKSSKLASIAKSTYLNKTISSFSVREKECLDSIIHGDTYLLEWSVDGVSHQYYGEGIDFLVTNPTSVKDYFKDETEYKNFSQKVGDFFRFYRELESLVSSLVKK